MLVLPCTDHRADFLQGSVLFLVAESLLSNVADRPTDFAYLRNHPRCHWTFFRIACGIVHFTLAIAILIRRFLLLAYKPCCCVAYQFLIELIAKVLDQRTLSAFQVPRAERWYAEVASVVVARPHGALQRLAGDPDPRSPAEDRGLLHVHVVSVEAGWAVRDEDVEIDEVLGGHAWSPFLWLNRAR
jgi:hypothetical protein